MPRDKFHAWQVFKSIVCFRSCWADEILGCLSKRWRLLFRDWCGVGTESLNVLKECVSFSYVYSNQFYTLVDRKKQVKTKLLPYFTVHAELIITIQAKRKTQDASVVTVIMKRENCLPVWSPQGLNPPAGWHISEISDSREQNVVWGSSTEYQLIINVALFNKRYEFREVK